MTSWKVFLGIGLASLAGAVRADTCVGTSNFSCCGQSQTYTVPANTSYIVVKCWGAGGGCGGSTPGGDGACSECSYNVTPGQTCTINVGGGGCGGSACSGGYPDGCTAPDRSGCGGGGGSTTCATPCGTCQAAGGCGGDCNGGWGCPGGCTSNPPSGEHWNSNSYSGCGGGSCGCSGSCFNSSFTCGGNGNPPCTNDVNYPGNNCACGGECGKNSDNGCNGGCCICAYQKTQPPVITSSLTASNGTNQNFTYNITATNSPTSYGASQLPSGLSVNSQSGLISGTAPAAGTYNITISATNSGGTGSATLVLTETQMYTLTIATSPSYAGTTGGAGSYPAGTTVTISEVANLGYATNGWSGPDGQATASPSSPTTSIVMSGNRSLTANFVATGTLTVASGTGGYATGGGVYDVGAAVPVSASALPGYVFSGWSGNGITNANASSTTVVFPGTETVTASFSPANPPTFTSSNALQTLDVGQPYSYQVSATYASSYSCSWGGLPPGLSINSSGLISGTPTTTGSWSCPVKATNSAGTTTQTLPITVVPTYTLSISGSPSGAGTFTGAGTYGAGTTVAISETANSGYRGAGWSGSGSGSVASPSSASTSVVINSNTSLVAQFVQQGTLTVNAGPGGTATGGGAFDVGTHAPIGATPSAGSNFTGWSGPGVANSNAASTTATVNGNTTVTANFAWVTPVVNSPTSASASQNEPFTYTVTASGSPTTYGATGLPPGLSINPTTGVISGTPTSSGTSTVTATASNGGETGSQTVTLTVAKTYTLAITESPSSGGTFTGAGTYPAGATVQISESANPGFRTDGWAGSGASSTASPTSAATSIVMNSNETLVAQFVAQATLTVVAGPGGTAIGSGTFDVGSKPTIAATPVNGSSFTGWTGNGVANSNALSTTVNLAQDETVTANFSIAITSPTTSSANLNEPYTYTITATGTPTTFSASGLPPGLTLYPSSGAITGTPTSAGTYPVTITASDGGESASATLTLTVAQTYSLTITANPATGGTFSGGGVYAPGTVVNIAQAPNLGYRTNGWGGPNGGSTASPGSPATTITMNGNATVVAEFVPQGMLTVVTSSGGSATGGGVYDLGTSPAIVATADPGASFTGWSGPGIADAGAASTTVQMSGNTTVTANFTWTTPSISSPLSGGADQNEPYTYTITASGSPSTFSASGLPPGLTINPSTGVISGTPTAGGTYPVVITASNGGGTGSATLVLTVAQTYTLSISGSPAAGGTYSGAGIYPAGTTVPISENANSGYRTAGWGGPDSSSTTSPSSAATSIVLNSNATLVADFVQQGTLTVDSGTGGTASGGGAYDLGSTPAITATPSDGYAFAGWSGPGVANSTAASTTATVTGNTTVTASFSVVTPVIMSPTTSGTDINQPYTYTITASGSPTTYGATGLPPGLALNPTTGVISGTPTTAGSYPVTITASNPAASGSTTLTITVAQTYTLTITGSPATGGTFSGAGVYAPGTVVTISEAPNGEFRTNGWGGPDAGSLADSTSATTTITMNADTDLTAQFVQQGTLTVVGTNGGSATGGGVYDIGTNAAITALPGTGDVFTGWTGPDGVSFDDSTSASTTVLITGDMTVTAGFDTTSPLQLGVIQFPNAVPPGISGVSPTTTTMPAVITNTGSATETITNLTTTGVFTENLSLPFTIAPGSSASVTVTFAPTALGETMGTLTAFSDSSSDPVAQFTLEGDGVNPAEPPSATISAPGACYSGSPVTVSGAAFAPDNNLTMQSIEWMAPGGTSWTVVSVAASGGNSSQTLGVDFPTTGNWTVRAAASIDGGNTWVYSSPAVVNVVNGITTYTLETMAVPFMNMMPWYSTSPVVEESYQVQHVNQ